MPVMHTVRNMKKQNESTAEEGAAQNAAERAVAEAPVVTDAGSWFDAIAAEGFRSDAARAMLARGFLLGHAWATLGEQTRCHMAQLLHTWRVRSVTEPLDDWKVMTAHA